MGKILRINGISGRDVMELDELFLATSLAIMRPAFDSRVSYVSNFIMRNKRWQSYWSE